MCVLLLLLLTGCGLMEPNKQTRNQTYRGRIEGGPATVVVVAPEDFRKVDQVRTDAEGYFTTSLPNAGMWWIFVQPKAAVAHFDSIVFDETFTSIPIRRQTFEDLGLWKSPDDYKREFLDFGAPAAKMLKIIRTEADIWGDINGDGLISIRDVTLLLTAILTPDSVDRLRGSLGDINEDGVFTWADVELVGLYLVNGRPEDAKVGSETELRPIAYLSPHPAAILALDYEWKTFRVHTNQDSVRVVVNSVQEVVPFITAVLEVAGGLEAPSYSHCPGEQNDFRYRKHLHNVHIATCAAGATRIEILHSEDNSILTTYEITIEPNSEGDDEID